MTFTPISEVGEFGLIARMQDVLADHVPASLVQGIGDDAAVYRIGEGLVHVTTTDALVEGVHFDRTFMPMGHLGWKAIAVNASDVVAMNALPRYATVALGLPGNVSVEAVEELYGGIAAACRAYGITLIGGDTTAAPRMMVSVTVIGEAREDEIVYRRGASPGDLLCVTGDLGSAYAGIRLLLAEKDRYADTGEQPDLRTFQYVVERQLRPQARLDTLRRWREIGVRPTALIDISDGLASEVNHLCRAGGVGALVETALLPVHLQTYAVAERYGEEPGGYALSGGEDYELLFAMPDEQVRQLDENTFAVVGVVMDTEDGVTQRSPEGEVTPLESAGFRHF
jgi:thiamine-monophosphate kinase